jgi:hypothetical protein
MTTRRSRAALMTLTSLRSGQPLRDSAARADRRDIKGRTGSVQRSDERREALRPAAEIWRATAHAVVADRLVDQARSKPSLFACAWHVLRMQHRCRAYGDKRASQKHDSTERLGRSYMRHSLGPAVPTTHHVHIVVANTERHRLRCQPPVEGGGLIGQLDAPEQILTRAFYCKLSERRSGLQADCAARSPLRRGSQLGSESGPFASYLCPAAFVFSVGTGAGGR